MENPETSLPVPAPMPAPRVATAGEALIDLIARPDGLFEPCLGGSVYNFTRAMARQGTGTLYLNPLSVDRFGRQLAAALAQDGVQLARPEPVPAVTSLAVVGLTAAGQPDYAFYRQGVADRQVSAVGLQAACAARPSLQVLCSGCLALAPDDGAAYLPFLAQSRAAGLTVVIDANLRPSVMPDLPAYRLHVRQALRHAHIVKASDEDLAHLGIEGADPLDQARQLLAECGAPWLVLTLGAAGACLLTASGQAWQARETAPVAVVDTVGAGDCFLAGLVSALVRAQLPVQPALSDADAGLLLRHGVASASLCVMQRGCVPPDLAAVQQRVAQWPAAVQRLG